MRVPKHAAQYLWFFTILVFGTCAFANSLPAAMAVASGGQQKPATNQSVSDLLAGLRSDDWTERAQAFERLRSDPRALSDSKVQEGLLSVLDRENQLVESTLRDSQGHVGVSDKYGEGFGEYVGELGETVDSFANWNDPHQVCIFVHEPYNPESRFAAKIASHANVSVPCLVQMYGSDVGLIRAEASAVLVQALGKSKNQIDLTATQKVKRVVLTALQDPDESVRSSTVRALGMFGEVDMIPALEQVAETDPSPEVQGHSIRKSATDAIASIQKRQKLP
jgi:hypothetical protein